MTIEEPIRHVCRRVARRIGKVTPRGLGLWDPAWELVREPSNAFMEALATWGEADTTESRNCLQAAAEELVKAWRRAGEEWEACGRPGYVGESWPPIADSQHGEAITATSSPPPRPQGPHTDGEDGDSQPVQKSTFVVPPRASMDRTSSDHRDRL